MLFKDISHNFSLAKSLSILMVITGHFFGGILWVPTTIALYIFAFSSGYFTATKYKAPLNLRSFWKAKFSRLVFALLVINFFLLALFLAQGKENIATWQTLIALVGASGLLNWLEISNPSPFGTGLWFFTLLLLFYLSYPLLAYCCRHRKAADITLIITVVITTVCEFLFPMGHMLWLTTLAFVHGQHAGHTRSVIPAPYTLPLFSAATLLLVLNKQWIHLDTLNYFFIMMASVSFSYYLLTTKLPAFIPTKLTLLSGSVLQIYFIHPYLLSRTLTSNQTANYFVSLAIILSIAFVLAKIAQRLTQCFSSQIGSN